MPTEADYRLADEWLAPYVDIRAMPSREIARERLAEKLALARDEALEEAAGLCDALYDATTSIDQTDPEQVWLDACDRAATAIRKLKDKRHG